MKTKVFLIAFLLLLANSALLSLGVRGGLDISNFRADKIAYNNSKYGFNVGIFSLNKIGNKGMIIQNELNLLQKGCSYKIEDEDHRKYEEKYTLTYLEIPVLLKKEIAGHSSALHLYAGPSIAFLTSAKEKVEYGASFASGDVSSLFNKLDICLNVGADVVLQNKIMLGARYNMGLLDIVNDNENNNERTSRSSNIKIYNTNYMINIGILL